MIKISGQEILKSLDGLEQQGVMKMRVKQNYQWNSMTMGTCYYPEQWDSSFWEKDLERMLDAGITVIRIGEFAWNKFEPREGEFTFEFFDRFLNLAHVKGMKVIFGTPTATPPAWLTEKYPEVLNARKDGVLYRHGGRRHYNYNSKKYRELCARIVEKIAEHIGQHPAVTGWQIDNEINCEINDFYSESDDAAFREFLKNRYESIDALNEAWGTVFWNQTYTGWEEVHLPRTLVGEQENPHQMLDYFRFVSDSALSFVAMQAGILRKYIPKECFITTNGCFDRLDNHKMMDESLDVYTYDSYPSFAFALDSDPLHSSDLNDRRWSMHLNKVRSICPHFGIMEQQSGANGWSTRMEGPAPRPGQLTLWAMQSVAHGADFISFFRWRTAVQGTEIYWHGILDYDNRDNRKLAEVKSFYQKLQTLEPLTSSRYAASFALLKDYDNEWDSMADSWHNRLKWTSEPEIFAASQLYHTPYDEVYLQEHTELEDLAGYPVLIYPHPLITDEKRVELLRQYAEQGGILILGCRAGLKDRNGHCVMLPQPGLFQALTGTDIRDFTFASPAEEDVYAEWNGNRMEMPLFHDILLPLDGTKVLAVYQNSYYAGQAALTEHKTGKGKVLHMGAAFSRQNVKQLLEYTGILEPFSAYAAAPEEIQLVLREKDGVKYLFALNYQAHEVSFELKVPAVVLYTGKQTEAGVQRLAAFETAVYALKRPD